MPFTLPTFNLTCNIWTGSVGAYPPLSPPTGSPRIAAQPCGLAHGKLSSKVAPIGSSFLSISVGVMQLLLPKGTDVRGIESNTAAVDLVECPAGTGRYYFVQSVDDVGKGFVNEYRLAFMTSIVESWLAPYP
jgi:hypothetical protein